MSASTDISGPVQRILVTGGSGFIGTNLIARLAGEPVEILNLDIAPPRPGLAPAMRSSWCSCDVMDAAATRAAFAGFRPQTVIHLAARTDMAGRTVADYAVNYVGSRHALDAARACGSVGRFVLASSQFVCGPGPLPADDGDFRPHTIYGATKVLAEQAVREAAPECCWTIVRPTNVWGPWHPRYAREFWRVLWRGLYLHPAGAPVIRSYAYVGNLVEQLLGILGAPPDKVHGRVLYLGDPPVELALWVNAFSVALTGRNARTVPIGLLRALALVGDGVEKVIGRAPLTRSRLRSMTEDYPTPMAPTFALLGPSRFSLAEGVAATVDWLASLPEFAGLQPQLRIGGNQPAAASPKDAAAE
jgi:nucleoside-diphosphate-sugar epimerase